MKKLLAFFLASFWLLHSDFSQSILTADGLAAYIPPAAGGGGGGGGSAFPSDSISADIRFNNGGTDSSGNGNTVTAHGTTSYVADEAGNATHAIQLDGSTGYADMVSAMNFGAGSFSVVTWCTNLSADFASPLSPVLWGNAAFGSGYYFQLQVGRAATL